MHILNLIKYVRCMANNLNLRILEDLILWQSWTQSTRSPGKLFPSDFCLSKLKSVLKFLKRLLATAVLVSQGSPKFVLSRIHGRYFCSQLTLIGQNRQNFIQVITPATSNGENGRVLCYKTFSVRKTRIPDFSGFFSI